MTTVFKPTKPDGLTSRIIDKTKKQRHLVATSTMKFVRKFLCKFVHKFVDKFTE